MIFLLTSFPLLKIKMSVIRIFSLLRSSPTIETLKTTLVQMAPPLPFDSALLLPQHAVVPPWLWQPVAVAGRLGLQRLHLKNGCKKFRKKMVFSYFPTCCTFSGKKNERCLVLTSRAQRRKGSLPHHHQSSIIINLLSNMYRFIQITHLRPAQALLLSLLSPDHHSVLGKKRRSSIFDLCQMEPPKGLCGCGVFFPNQNWQGLKKNT